MNALRPDAHTIRSVSDLDPKLIIAGDDVLGNVNINFTTDLSDETQVTVRIATHEFVQGDLPANTSVFVDVDVFTKDNFRTKDPNIVKGWVEFAHAKEKEQFFRLLPQPTIELRGKNGNSDTGADPPSCPVALCCSRTHPTIDPPARPRKRWTMAGGRNRRFQLDLLRNNIGFASR